MSDTLRVPKGYFEVTPEEAHMHDQLGVAVYFVAPDSSGAVLLCKHRETAEHALTTVIAAHTDKNIILCIAGE
jgi:hypothetical protein